LTTAWHIEQHLNNKNHKYYEEEATCWQQQESQLVSMHTYENGCWKSSLASQDIEIPPHNAPKLSQGRCEYT
jgi:hypothetical protein